MSYLLSYIPILKIPGDVVKVKAYSEWVKWYLIFTGKYKLRVNQSTIRPGLVCNLDVLASGGRAVRGFATVDNDSEEEMGRNDPELMAKNTRKMEEK